MCIVYQTGCYIYRAVIFAFCTTEKDTPSFVALSRESWCGFMESWWDHFSTCAFLQRDLKDSLCLVFLHSMDQLSLNPLEAFCFITKHILCNANLKRAERYCHPLRNYVIGSSSNGLQRTKEDVSLPTILLQVTAF